MLKKHALELKKQIVEKSELTEQERKQRDIENQKAKELHDEKARLLERIKQEKIQ